jgi:hypothetical protein
MKQHLRRGEVPHRVSRTIVLNGWVQVQAKQQIIRRAIHNDDL